MRRILIFLPLLTLAGCTLGPDFVRPITMAEKKGDFLNAALIESHDTQPINQWWTRINDPLLHAYVDKLLSDNLQISQAKERIIQAQENAAITNGDFFPAFGANANAGRSFTNPNATPQSKRLYNSSYSASLEASWQVDLFGKIRRGNEASHANFEAALHDQQALIHSLIAQIFNRRIAISTLKHQRELAQENTDNREKLLTIVTKRYERGVRNTSASDTYLAQENYTTANADINRFNRLIAENVYAIDVLLGQTPGTSTPSANGFPLVPAPFTAPLCLPADLLDRRPDLRASELRLKAANANIGVAIADLYPSLNLSGSLGFNSNEPSNLFSAQQLAGSVLSRITSRLFEGGKLRANIRLKESQAREQAAAYAENILNAIADVENALKAEDEIAKQVTEIEKSVQSLTRAEELSEERYIRGIISLSELLETQQRRYTTQQNLLTLQQARWEARSALYLSLGGDWLKTPAHDLDNASCQQPTLNKEHTL